MALNTVKRDWEELASLDPLWAVLTEPERRYGGWDVEAFFETGEHEIARVVGLAEALGYPLGGDAALDFGCGVGRVTRALARRFETACGVDISERMLSHARELNSDMVNCKFIRNDRPDLRLFRDHSFDFVYSSRVLQHLPNRQTVSSYLIEFLRVVRERGIVVFQVRDRLRLRHALQPKRRVYATLRRVGLSERVLYEKLRLNPMRTISMPEHEADRSIEAGGGVVIHREQDAWGSSLYFVRRAHNVSRPLRVRSDSL